MEVGRELAFSYTSARLRRVTKGENEWSVSNLDDFFSFLSFELLFNDILNLFDIPVSIFIIHTFFSLTMFAVIDRALTMLGVQIRDQRGKNVFFQYVYKSLEHTEVNERNPTRSKLSPRQLDRFSVLLLRASLKTIIKSQSPRSSECW